MYFLSGVGFCAAFLGADDEVDCAVATAGMAAKKEKMVVADQSPRANRKRLADAGARPMEDWMYAN